MGGYIKLWRCLQDNPLWHDEAFTRGQAWVDLLLIANHSPGQIRRRGIKVSVGRGEVGASLRTLADRWKWSLGKVQRFFDELKTDTQIHYRTDTENVNVTTLICITNYEKYQQNDTETDTETGTETDTETGTETDTETIRKRVQNKKKKEEKEVKKESIGIVKQFEICVAWKAFVEMRKIIKKPMTPYAMQLRAKDLMRLQAEGHDPVAVLNQSIANNWQDLYPVKVSAAASLKSEDQSPPLIDPALSTALRKKLAQYEETE